MTRKIGQAKKKPADEKQAYTKAAAGGDKGVAPVKKDAGGGGFNENDIEFMKKAI
jgi:hypothetical protein